MSSNAFRMYFEETVKQFIDLRDQSLRKAIELSEKPGIIFQKRYRFLCFFLCNTNFPDISMAIVQARVQNVSK